MTSSPMPANGPVGFLPLTALVARDWGSRSAGRADALRFDVLCGYDHYVQVTDNPGDPTSWRDLPHGPHNGGLVIYTRGQGTRFYRVKIVPRENPSSAPEETPASAMADHAP